MQHVSGEPHVSTHAQLTNPPGTVTSPRGTTTAPERTDAVDVTREHSRQSIHWCSYLFASEESGSSHARAAFRVII